jgi:two-component system LytT family response regulator
MIGRRWRALIVDDEPPARRSLQILLSRYPAILVDGECDHATAAVDAIRRSKPDLLFIDVQMPDASGLDVVHGAGIDAVPVVVFTTAYAEYALQAFEAHAFDYLLKPWSDERFAEVMGRVLRALEVAAVAASVDAETRTLVIRDGARTVIIPIAEIDWIEAEDYCTRIHAGDRHPLVRRSLRSLLADLPPATFARIHRSSIVNLDRIRELRPTPAGDAEVLLRNGTVLRMSRTYRFPTR